MATRYVGPGGSNANSGLTWALRKLDLNGAEDTPVAAGDVIYVGPGTYRELLTLDVSGSAGNPISYISDVTGQNTDGVGGVVRITGSDNDTTTTRANCISGAGRSYRTFRGFTLDTTSGAIVNLTSNPGNCIIEDCVFNTQIAAANSISFSGTGTDNTVRRCVFYGGKASVVSWTHSSTVSNAAGLVENCIFLGANGRFVDTTRVGGLIVRNCLFVGSTSSCVRVVTALAGGQTVTVNNCILASNAVGMQGTALGEIVEDYNSFFGNATDRTTVNTGTNSDVFPAPLDFGVLLAGFALVRSSFSPAPFSPLRAITGTGQSAEDFYGKTKPATAAKISRGPIQFTNISREATTVRTGAASIKLADAGRHQMYVPVTNVSTVFSVYVQWEADYAGTKPQMIIKQPGQSDVTVTATGSSGSWELLTTTLTPAALPGFVIVELVSNNTASATNFDCFFDDLTVT